MNNGHRLVFFSYGDFLHKNNYDDIKNYIYKVKNFKLLNHVLLYDVMDEPLLCSVEELKREILFTGKDKFCEKYCIPHNFLEKLLPKNMERWFVEGHLYYIRPGQQYQMLDYLDDWFKYDVNYPNNCSFSREFLMTEDNDLTKNFIFTYMSKRVYTTTLSHISTNHLNDDKKIKIELSFESLVNNK